MKPRFGDKIKVCYKDTDSLLYRVETENFYSEIATFKHFLDLSDYPAEHFLHDKMNKKVPLTMTYELQGKVLSEVVCLQSKLYSIQIGGGVKQSTKGVQKSVKKTLNDELYKECLLNKGKVKRFMTQLRSINHQIVVSLVHNVALSSYDDKRYLLNEGIHWLTYGHYKVKGQPSSNG